MFELKSVLYFVFVFLLPEIKFVGFWGLFGTWDACYTSRLCHCFFVNRYVLHAQNSQLFSGGKPFSVYLDFLRLCHCSELFVYNFVPDHCNTEAQKWSYQKKFETDFGIMKLSGFHRFIGCHNQRLLIDTRRYRWCKCSWKNVWFEKSAYELCSHCVEALFPLGKKYNKTWL